MTIKVIPCILVNPCSPLKRHQALDLMTSLRRAPNRGLLGRGEDCTTPPVEGIWTTVLVCLGSSEISHFAGSLTVLLPAQLRFKVLVNRDGGWRIEPSDGADRHGQESRICRRSE